MTLLAFGEIRLDPRSHKSALNWIELLYRHPKKVEEAEESLSRWQKTVAVLRIYLHALPYLILVDSLGRWFLASVTRLEVVRTSLLIPAWAEGLWLHGSFLTVGLAIGLAVGIVFGFAGGLAFGLAGGLASGLAFGLAFGFSVSLAFGPAGGLASGVAVGIAVDLAGGLGGGLAVGIVGGLAAGLALAGGLPGGLACGLAIDLAYAVGFLRLYYLPIHCFWIWPRVRASLYRFHPIAWDDVCLFPFPGLDRLLLAYVALDREAGEGEIDRLIDEYPTQRSAAFRARAILVIRRAAMTENLAQLDEVLDSLPTGERGFLRQTKALRDQVHSITTLQAQLDTLDRPFMRYPFAALLVKEIETFGQQVAGFEPPLSTELRKAARQWLEIARRELDTARTAATREPTRQVFRAGDPVDREREAFVLRAGILGELECQVMLATGCPGLLLYSRRRMGKSTLLRNLEGLLPPRVQVVHLSMQQAGAFASLPDLIELIARRVAAVVPELPKPPANLKGLESFLDATQKRLEARDHKLLLALDEYENLDRKIGEGVFSEDLLAVLRESIQAHRRILWTFAGSHGIDELRNAPWASYLVSARTLEVGPFEPAETRLLLTEPLKHSSLWSSVEAERPRFEPGFWGAGGIQRVHVEADGWPHLVQLVAETIVDLVNDAGATIVDEALLGRAFDRAVVRGNNVFLELVEKESHLHGEWDYLTAFRTTEELPPPADEAVGRSLRRRLLVLEEDGRFRLRVPLFARWLRKRI